MSSSGPGNGFRTACAALRFLRLRLVPPLLRVALALVLIWTSLIPQTVLALDTNPQNDNAQVSVTIRPRDKYPPSPITDLDAAQTLQEGEILLAWTAPDEDDLPQPANDPVKHYYVHYATFSVPDLGGDTTSWWTQSSTAANAPFPPQAQGRQESFLLTGLDPGATYFFAVRSDDEKDNLSLIDSPAQNGPQAQALVLDLPPSAITGLAASVSTDSVVLSWSPNVQSDVTSYRIYWDSSAPADIFTATVTLPAGTTTYTFANLTTLNTYYFRLTALDRGQPSFPGNILESTPSATVTAIPSLPVPDAPSSLMAAAVSTSAVTWQWTDNAVNETGFRLFTSSGGLAGTNAGTSPGTGLSVSLTETNLAPNTLYSRLVRAFNVSAESLDSNTTDRYTLSNPPAATGFTAVGSSSVSIAWSANGNPAGTIYEAQISSDSAFSQTASSATLLTNALFANLTGGASYYFRVRSRNAENVASAYDNSVATRTASGGVQGLAAAGGNRRVTLDWADSAEPGVAGYFVYRSTLSAGPLLKQNLTALTTSAYLDTGLTNGVTYFYAVSLLDAFGQESALSNTVSAKAAAPARPKEPTGVIGSLRSDGIFSMRWTPVTQDVQNSTDVEIAAYRIYKSSSADGPFSLRDSVSPSTYSWLSLDLAPPTVWYMIRALDSSDNESADSLHVESVAAPSYTAVSPDETLQIVFPQGDTGMLNAETNNLSEDVRMVIQREPEQEQGTVLGSYDVKAVGAVTGNEIKDLKIPRPTVRLEFRYAKGIAGAPMARGVALKSFVGSVKDVGIFHHNNVEFVKFGGEVDEFKGTIAIKTAQPLGQYQVRNVLRATEFTLNQLTPRKIFTPNGDGVNDEMILYLENPRESVITQARIYDITGAHVADFEQGVVAGSFGIISLKWNGRDASGNQVRSGIYIYQVQAEGKTINGTMVVAR